MRNDIPHKSCNLIRLYIFLFLIPVENENHCDFVKLREMLIRTNMEDLRETTHSRHYELYRRNKLENMGFTDSESQRWVKIGVW